MATPPIPEAEITRRREAVEACLAEGYAPLGQSGGRGSAVEEAARRLEMNGATLSNSIRRGGVAPDWSLYVPPVREARRGRVECPPFQPAPVPPGYVLKGQSALVGPDGELRGRWDKTGLEGMDPADAIMLPDPKRITKLSTLRDSEGRIVQQWTAERPEDQEREALWLAFAEELAAKAPRVEPIPPPENVSSSLLAGYPIGDHHLGLLSWKDETGSNYDLKAGTTLLRGAMAYLTQAVGAAETAIVALMGDFLHVDNFESVTPTNRNMLDADSRLPKVGRAAAALARNAVAAALAAHQTVHVYVIPGNHDPVSAMFLRLYLEAVYENEPRVAIETSPAAYQYHRFGNCLIGMHHGHGAKLQDLPLIMATDRAKDWGATTYRYVWTGHTHKDAVADIGGCKVESFRVLPPADAWAHGKGYRPGREMKGILYHKQFGEQGRTVFNPHMLYAGATTGEVG